MTTCDPNMAESRRGTERTNRVTPFGSLEATSARGSLMGNRGILHDDAGQLGRARWRHRSWITCLLEFKGRHRTINTPGEYTELFFHDEAVAFAAGHRPCAQCRRPAYDRYRTAWRKAQDLDPNTRLTASEIDTELHRARVDQNGVQVTYFDQMGHLPDGVFVIQQKISTHPLLLWRGHLYPWSHDGYGRPHKACLKAFVRVLTPLPHVRVLSNGYALRCCLGSHAQ